MDSSVVIVHMPAGCLEYIHALAHISEHVEELSFGTLRILQISSYHVDVSIGSRSFQEARPDGGCLAIENRGCIGFLQ
ncbi:hypothetical protein D3C85_1356630 [compost metagenome]